MFMVMIELLGGPSDGARLDLSTLVPEIHCYAGLDDLVDEYGEVDENAIPDSAVVHVYRLTRDLSPAGDHLYRYTSQGGQS